MHGRHFKNMWDWFILVLTIYTSVMVPFNMAFRSQPGLVLLDNLVDIIFFVDIVIIFCSFTRYL